MKKVLFLQNEGKIYGGVWQVNRLVGEELIKLGYDVSVLSITEKKTNLLIEHDKRLKVITLNPKEEWQTYIGSDFLKAIKKGKIIKILKMFLSRIKHTIIRKIDTSKLHKFIKNYQPDYIISSHYELLPMIPKNYLNKTIHQQHSSFDSAFNHRATINTLKKYQNKITYLWLSKNTMNNAIKEGFNNSYYIYNSVRFISKDRADVLNNKKLITIARLSKEKNIALMIVIVKELFQDQKFSKWNLEIYGDGEEELNLKKLINNHPQIHLMGKTINPKEKLLNSSINLNTSDTEGFCLSILEANECGIPTVSFDFGESAQEEILNYKTGIIAKNKQDYLKSLKKIMQDEELLLKLSKECKKYSQQFRIQNIIKEWTKLFEIIDNKNQGDLK